MTNTIAHLAKRIALWPLEELKPYANNPRTHSEAQVEQIAASIAEFGFNNPILVDKEKGIIAGHGRLAAARKLDMEQVPVVALDHLSDAQRRAYIIADNNLAENAGWDYDLLAQELQALELDHFDIALTGFTEDEIAAFSAAEEPAQTGNTDDDAVPATPDEPISKRGDIWLLGKHRVMCGDATDYLQVQQLMAGKLADLIFTDPPYNVDYEGYTEEQLKIENDHQTEEQFLHFLDMTFAVYAKIIKLQASVYVCHGSIYQREFQNALEKNGFAVRNQIIWAKNHFAWGYGRYKFQHEPIFYCHLKEESDAWYGDKSQSTLWQCNKPTANRLHPTMKPVELIELALQNSSKANNIVVDLFGGSGSTLIACEKNHRAAYLMELDPHYTDVIVKRWEEWSGKMAKRLAAATG